MIIIQRCSDILIIDITIVLIDAVHKQYTEAGMALFEKHKINYDVETYIMIWYLYTAIS